MSTILSSSPTKPDPTSEFSLSRSRKSSLVAFPPNPVKPNAHPYAIKTTSTGLLSRSSSSPHHSSPYQHYIPPESPTKRSSGQFISNGIMSNGNGNGHRYSRSMTEEPPRSLPIPPSPGSRPSSLSPRKNGFLELGSEADDGQTPRRRAESASGDGLFRDMDLPDDPKRWDALQLATYLSTKIPSEIANFVREQRISGRAFLRLSERDLEDFGMDRRWVSTLLDASRSLRQSTLRGRIWGFGNTPESAYNLPSRTRSDSMSSEDEFQSSSSYHNGRVKGMVASFESSSSGSEQEDRSRSASPTKTSRGLPQRPKVIDLFNPPPPPPPLSASPTYEEELTVKGPLPNRHKELPRLLPFPPPQLPPPPPSLTPAHTGTGYLLPASPDHEMGYRPLQKPARLLPIPPVLVPSPDPAAHLHHPRPIRGVSREEPSVEELLATQQPGGGAGGEAWELELGATVRRISGEGDKTAAAAVEGAGAGSSFVIGRTGRSVRRVKPKVRPAEGAEAGEERRSSGESGSIADFFSAAPVKTTREVETQTDEEESEKEGLASRKLELDKGFEELNHQREVNDEKKVELAHLEDRLAVRDSEVSEREREVEYREKEVERRESELDTRVTAAVAARQAELQQSLDQAAATRGGLDARDVAISAREKTVEEREKAVEARSSALQKKEEDLVTQETTLNLAARLMRRIVGKTVVPVFGNGVANFILKPLGGQRDPQVAANGNPSTPAAGPHRPTGFSWLDGLPLAQGRAPYIVLLGLGMCAAVLRVLMKKVLLIGAVKVSGRVVGAAPARR